MVWVKLLEDNLLLHQTEASAAAGEFIRYFLNTLDLYAYMMHPYTYENDTQYR